MTAVPLIPTPNENVWAKTDKEKADLSADNLAKVFTPSSDEPDQEMDQYSLRALQQTPNPKFSTPNEIQEEIKWMNEKSHLNSKNATRTEKKRTIYTAVYFYYPKKLKTAPVNLVKA